MAPFSNIEIINLPVSKSEFNTKTGIHFYSSDAAYFLGSPQAGFTDTTGSSDEVYNLDIDNNSLVFKRKISGSHDNVDLFHLTSSGTNPRLGIGFKSLDKIIKPFEIRTATGSEPASIVLRTNEDGVVQLGEETGRIIFARESASFHPELDEFIISGSTAEIFSRVTGINGGTPFGSLVFQTNTDAGTVNQEVMEIGPGKGSTQATAPGVGISGSLKIIDSIPIFELQESNGNTKPIEIRVKSTDNDHGIIKVREAGNTIVSIGDDSAGGYHLISGSGMLFASLSLDSSNFKTVMYDTSSGKFFFTGSYGGGGSAGADNLGDHTATQDLDMAGNSISDSLHITASGNISASGQLKIPQILTGVTILGENGSTSATSEIKFKSATGFRRTISFVDSSDTVQWGMGVKTSALNGDFKINGGSNVNLDNDGGLIIKNSTYNVGIGTKEAPEKLTVHGNILASGSKFLGHVTASGDISGSSMLFASLSLDSSNFKTVMYDTSSGKFFFTGSYGGGGGGSTPTLQEVTDAGATTTNNIDIDGVLSLGGFSDVSASLAAAVAGGDDLGNHTATTDLNLADFNIKNVTHITASGNISSSGNLVIGGTAVIDDNVTLNGAITTIGNEFDSDRIDAKAFFTSRIHVTNHISASGNISASRSQGAPGGGTIFGHTGSFDLVTAQNALLNETIIAAQGSFGVNTTTNIGDNLTTTGHVLATNITASNNISASGIVIADTGSFNEINALEGDFGGVTTATSIGANIFTSGDIETLQHITASGNISASGTLVVGGNILASGIISGSSLLFASLSLDSTTAFKTVMYDTATGQFFHTGSYGGGGGSGATPTLQEVTDEGATTTNGSLFLQNQILDYGFSNGQNATSGFRSDGTNAFTHVTPQRFENRFYILGSIDAGGAGPAPFPNNHIVFDKPLVYQGFPGNGGGGPQDDGPVRPQIQGEVDIVLLNPKTTAGTGSKDPKGGILITPGSSDPGIYFFTNDASGSVSGSHLINSASAQIRFSTGSNAIKFFAGSTNETLKEVLHISKSGDNPRIGIGTSTPLRAFDFKEVRDDNRGGEILIRGSRTTKGAENNDEVGRINFAIDSASFGKIDTSGSAAEIVAIVDDIDATGVQGSLSLRIAASKTAGTVQRIKIDQNGTEFTGSAAFDTDVTIGDDLTVSDFALLNSARIGSTATDPGDGVLYVEDYGVFVGGLKVGSSEDPGANNLIVDGTTTLKGITNIGNQITDTLIVSASNVDFPSVVEKSSVATTDNILILEGDRVKQTPQSGLPYVITLDDGGGVAPDKRIAMFTGSGGKTIIDVPGIFHNSGTGLNISNSGTVFDLTAGKTFITNLTLTGNITASGNISSSEEITSNTFKTISTTLASDSITNVDTFNSSSYNGAIYDYILKDTGVGARAGQFMVAHDGGSVTFTDTSTKHLTDSTIPEITADINGEDVRVRITNGNGYTFKSFVKKL